ncbi:MAG: hypothetical protein ACUVRD_05400 [Bacteroidia bacterium]
MRTLSITLASWLSAQLEFTFLATSNFRSNPYYRIELTNTTSQPYNLSQHYLVTRDFCMRIGRGVIPPMGKFLMAKETHAAYAPVDMLFLKEPDFLIRVDRSNEVGNYVALLDSAFQLVSGVYLAPLRSVSYLPDTAKLILSVRPFPTLKIFIPPETHPKWKYLQGIEDPLLAYEQRAQRWHLLPNNPTKAQLFLRPVEFKAFTGQRQKQGNLLVWEAVEKLGQYYLVERSTDGNHFQPIARLACQEEGTYFYFDSTDAENVFYRIRHPTPLGEWISSPILKLSTQRITVPFWYEVERAQEGTFIRFRFSQGQPLWILQLDKNLVPQKVLYEGWIPGGVENLLSLSVQQGYVIFYGIIGRYVVPL